MQKTLLALLGISSSMFAAQNPDHPDHCAPEPGAMCYPDECIRCYCLGPENIMVNAPVCPVTCAGDFTVSIAGLYWTAHEDGLEFAIDNQVKNTVPDIPEAELAPLSYDPAVFAFNNLVDARYISPKDAWDFGFKLGFNYCNPCDGWDIGVYWTWFKTTAKTIVESEVDDNHTLLPLWSGFSPAPGLLLYATEAAALWRLDLNLVDIELGRNFWTSKYLTIRPHIGLRVAFINQDYRINYKGGAWAAIPAANGLEWSAQSSLNNEVRLDNDFKGVGLRGGLDSTWNFGCGWGLYGNLAAAIVYGRFDIDHDERNRVADTTNSNNFDTFKILETEDSFRVSRAMIDLGLGIQWSGLICDCKYGLSVSLGWEQHLFFHQNQMWRVTRFGDNGNDLQGVGLPANTPNNTGENVHQQRRGNIDTAGITFRVKFDF